MMYCRNCGSQMDDQAVVCVKCGVQKNVGNNYCYNCGSQVDKNAVACINCGAGLNNQVQGGGQGKSRILVGLMGIFFGCFGVHNFILGYTKRALIQLLVSLLTCGIGVLPMWIWALVESIQILNRQVTVDANNVPLID